MPHMVGLSTPRAPRQRLAPGADVGTALPNPQRLDWRAARAALFTCAAIHLQVLLHPPVGVDPVE